MPGWHEATKRLQDEGRLQMLGIVQEQHPDRARLFMQWKQMEWPILVDSLNLLDVAVVPVTLALDEWGVVRLVNPPLDDPRVIEEFLAAEFEPPSRTDTSLPVVPPLAELARQVHESDQASDWEAYGAALLLWQGAESLDDVVSAFERALRKDRENQRLLFRTGVAHRARFDSAERREGDFQKAVDYWTRALERDPNQYIWRRRLQQFGPRPAQPYPFYDWVVLARREIRERGEEPHDLLVEPGAAERAFSESSRGEDAKPTEPDPHDRVLRDGEGLIRVETTVVPFQVEAGGAARVYLTMIPDKSLKAHWNNEVDDLLVWIRLPDGWKADSPLLRYRIPPEPVTAEERTLEVELRSPESAPSGRTSLPAYALYYVCEDVDGTCLYRRRDLEIAFEIR